MTWKRNNHQYADSASAYTVIKRVVTTSAGYHCGICRARYTSSDDAKMCLDRCWSKQLVAYPTVAIRKGQCTLHRCRFCKREFPDSSDALICAKQCAESAMTHGHRVIELNDHRTIREGRLDRLVAQKTTKSIMMPFQVRNVLYNQKTMKSLSRAMLKIASGIAVGTRRVNKLHIQDNQGGAAMSRSSESSEQPVSGVKKNPDKKFYRDGAKYVCAVCKAKYFTKLEVESCWNAH